LLMPSHFLAHQETQADSDHTISFLFVDYLHLTIHSHNMFLFSCQGWNRYFAIVQMVEFCPVCPGLFSWHAMYIWYNHIYIYNWIILDLRTINCLSTNRRKCMQSFSNHF
jgi:hypothetical protein